jgi:CRISPR system Cascade subunit CasA
MPSFNLVKEKWIPCIMLDGKPDEMGLLDALTRAHEIREIFDPSPLVALSLHRLLLAILHRNFAPANLEEWEALWNRRKWDDKKLSEYFIRWEHRFDLFDKERPFYQSPERPAAEKHPVLRLAMEASSGNNATLFDHNTDAEPEAVAPDIAARYVVSA